MLSGYCTLLCLSSATLLLYTDGMKADMVPVQLRMTKEQRDRLKAAADADGRSLNSYIVRLLDRHTPPKPR